MGKLNCWEFKKCNREPGGRLAGELGICPASTDTSFHKVHDGMNGGRACWVIAGTFCGGAIQGSEAQKQHNCWRCDFFQHVKKEEEPTAVGFSGSILGMQRTLKRIYG
jgi:hypothetical protein